jgi:hypothetical protein
VLVVADDDRRRELDVGPGDAAKRDTAAWNSVSEPPRARNCFGKPARDSGHKRVPPPPAMTTGCTRIWVIDGLEWLQSGRPRNGPTEDVKRDACGFGDDAVAGEATATTGAEV